METKQTDIAKNVSSGAEKAESIAKQTGVKKTAKQTGTPKTAKKAPSATKKTAKTAKKSSGKGKAKVEKERAKKRVDVALKKEERKAKREEMKAARKAKKAERKQELSLKKEKRKEERAIRREKAKARAAETKRLAQEKRAEKKAERAARKALLKHESKQDKAARKERERAEERKAREEKRERAYRLKLEKRDAKLKKREQRMQDRAHRREQRRPSGIGGWLAAVISLGAVSLVLTALLTYGALDMRATGASVRASYRSGLYELAEIVGDADNDLNKIRVSSSSGEQSRLLTDLLLQSRLAESNLEKMPLAFQEEENTTAFFNRTARTAERLLSSLRSGGMLGKEDRAVLEELYRTNHELYATLNDLARNATDKTLQDFVKGKGKNALSKGFLDMENLTAAESGNALPRAPFEEGVKDRTAQERITSVEAERLCKEYFKNYPVRKTEYLGETISPVIDSYNFYLYDEAGEKLFVSVAKSGELAGFHYYKDCKKRNFDFERGLAIAEDYLKNLGYTSVTAVWASESGAEADYKFVYDDGTALYYPDAINVKVCLERGVVSGLDATAYIRNHADRYALNVKLSPSQAQNKLCENLQVLANRLCVIPSGGREIAAYEFVCEYDDEQYYVYVNAESGEEEAILLVERSAQGRILR